jgi:restriction system protein
VQEVVAGRLHYGADMAVVVSTAPYTYAARELAASTRVLLLHHDQLANLDELLGIR